MALAVYAIANMPTPEMPNAKAVGLDEFDHPTADSSRAIPEIFGTNLINGINLIYMSDFNANAIIDKVETGKKYYVAGPKKYKKYTTGYAYTASLIFAIGGKIDEFRSFWIGDDKVADIEDINNFETYTGKKSEQSPSIAKKNKLYFYNGEQNEEIHLINEEIIGKDGNKISKGTIDSELSYSGTSLVAIPSCFMGDNVSSLPKYAFEVSRYNLTDWNLDDENWTDRINEYDINPASAIFYILKNMLKIEEENIDIEAFKSTALILKNENFGMSFSISSVNSAKKWPILSSPTR